MLDKCASGIDLITENLGELYSRGTYLFMGDPKTGKTTFVLQFILQGLKEGKSCILVTSDSARDFAINAETLGMPVSPYILEGRLIIYEYAVTKKFTAEQFFKDIIGVVSEHEISRFALDSFIGQKIPAAEIQVFSQKLPDFLDEMEKL